MEVHYCIMIQTTQECKEQRTLERHKQGIVLEWNFHKGMEFPYGLGTISEQHEGRCKSKGIEKQACLWEGRVMSRREMDSEVSGVHNRSYCHCKAQGLSYLLLHDNCWHLIYLLPHGPFIYRALQSTEMDCCLVRVQQQLSQQEMYLTYPTFHMQPKKRLSIDAVNLTCSCNLHQYFHSFSALIFSQTLLSDLGKTNYFQCTSGVIHSIKFPP